MKPATTPPAGSDVRTMQAEEPIQMGKTADHE